MDILKGFFDGLDSDKEYLNKSGGKSIQVCFDPARLPNLMPVYKLNDHNHGCHLTFSKETMDMISSHSYDIEESLEMGEPRKFFRNNELRVFSEEMHNQCAVSFCGTRGVRINMMIETFQNMVGSADEVYSKVQKRVKDTSKNLKQLINVLIDKRTQSNAELESFLQQLHQFTSSFNQQGANLPNGGNQIRYDDDDDDDEYEDEEVYDEDEDMDDE